jgi:hypothetical protein
MLHETPTELFGQVSNFGHAVGDTASFHEELGRHQRAGDGRRLRVLEEELDD